MPNFNVDALPHFRCACRDLDRAVRVDVHQGIALIEKLRRKRDAELDARHRQTAELQPGVGVEISDLFLSLLVLRPGSQRREDFRQMVLVEHLAVGRDVPLTDSIEIGQSHVVGVAAQKLGDRLQDVLGDRHRLRPAEAAECRVGRDVGETDATVELHVWAVVATIGVQQGPLQHGGREIGRRPAVGKEVAPQCLNPALAVEANFPAGKIFMPFAGHSHVIVFVVDHAGRSARLLGHECSHEGGNRRLGLFAAERSAHPFADAHDLVLPQPEHVGNDCLDFGRILSRGVHDQLPLLARIGDGRLRLQIKLLLPTAGESAREPMLGGCQIAVDVAPGDSQPRAQEPFAANRLLQVQQGLSLAVLHLHRLAALLQRFSRLGGHHGNWLANVEQLLLGQERLVGNDQAEHVVPGHVRSRVTGHHPRYSQGRRNVHRKQLATGDGAANKPDVQFAIESAQIVQIQRLARDVASGGIVRQRFSNGRHADDLRG